MVFRVGAVAAACLGAQAFSDGAWAQVVPNEPERGETMVPPVVAPSPTFDESMTTPGPETPGAAAGPSGPIAWPTGPAVVDELVAQPDANAPIQPRKLPRISHLGLMGDVGTPEGMNASLVLRPWRWLHLAGGVGHNGAAAGYRGGVTLVPWGTGLSLTAEAGYNGPGNLSGAAALVGTPIGADLFRRVSYTYANFHLGYERGNGRVAFFVHAGLSFVRATLGDFATTLGRDLTPNTVTSSSKTTVTVNGDATVRGAGVSGKLGFVVYLD